MNDQVWDSWRYARFRRRLERSAELAGRLRTRLRFLISPTSVGKGSWVSPRAVVSSVRGGRITLGEDCVVGTGALLLSYGGDILIGDRSSVNPYCVLYGHGGLTIGSGVRIAAHTVIIPAHHGFDDLETWICSQPLSCQGIHIEDNVWIGAGARVLDGVTIRRGCVIGAGAVVCRSTEENGVYTGVPARLQRFRNA